MGKLHAQRGCWPSSLGKVPAGGERPGAQLLDISGVLLLDQSSRFSDRPHVGEQGREGRDNA